MLKYTKKELSVIAVWPLFYRDLIGKGYTETYYSEDGERVTTSPNEVRFILVILF